jgi:hypothetical protein
MNKNNIGGRSTCPFYIINSNKEITVKKIGQLILAILVLPAIAMAGSEKENENWSVVSLKRHQIESKFLKRDIRLKV